MKERWLPVLGLAVALVACAPDTTLESLVPRSSLAVLWIERPELLPAQWGVPLGDLPRGLLGKGPWAATVHPGPVPGFRLYVSLKEGGSWPALEDWARHRGGLEAVKVGDYAVLSSPGLPAVVPLAVDQRFDPRRLGWGEVKLFLQVAVVEAWVDRLGWKDVPVPWAEFRREVSGVHLGLGPKDGGLELVVSPEFRTGAWKDRATRLTPPPLEAWGPRVTGEGLTLDLSLPRDLGAALGSLSSNRGWRERWAAFAPLVGPRGTFHGQPRADGTWSWVVAVESLDPQAVRQGLRALVAGGDIQALFPWVAEDADTPVIFQDRPDGLGGIVSTLVLGSQKWWIGYGTDRVVIAGGAGAPEALRVWGRAPVVEVRQPPGTWAAAEGFLDGLGARASLRVSRGQFELRVEVSAREVPAWRDRLPQALIQWLSGEGGWTVFEP